MTLSGKVGKEPRQRSIVIGAGGAERPDEPSPRRAFRRRTTANSGGDRPFQPAAPFAGRRTDRRIGYCHCENDYDMFRDLNRKLGLTIVIVSHDPGIAQQVDRVVAVRDGKLATELCQ